MNATQPAVANRLIAIVGGTGAGKGWMAHRLCTLLGDPAGHLSLDDFYRDWSHLTPANRNRVNFDNPRAIDWPRAERVLHDCIAGRATRVPRYDFSTHTRLTSDGQWQPTPLVVVEGLWLLRHASTRRLFSLTIYLDCPASLRLNRRRSRDVAERGRTVDAVERQFRLIAPFHDRYVEPQKQWADLVISHPFSEPDLNRLAERLWALIQATSLRPAWMHEAFRADLLTLLETDEYTD